MPSARELRQVVKEETDALYNVNSFEEFQEYARQTILKDAKDRHTASYLSKGLNLDVSERMRWLNAEFPGAVVYASACEFGNTVHVDWSTESLDSDRPTFPVSAQALRSMAGGRRFDPLTLESFRSFATLAVLRDAARGMTSTYFTYGSDIDRDVRRACIEEMFPGVVIRINASGANDIDWSGDTAPSGLGGIHIGAFDSSSAF